MQQVIAGRDGALPESVVTPGVGRRRLVIGLLQGLLLYLLHSAAQAKVWPATAPFLFTPLLLICLITPVLWMSSLGHVARKTTAAWVLVSGTLIACLGWYDVWRAAPVALFGEPDVATLRYPSSLLIGFLFVGFFIAHSLLLSSAQDRCRIARYATHFETSWKLAIQLAFSALFVGVLWAALWIGASLFMLVKLDFFKELLQQSWFFIPVTTFGYACAMHITDVRPGIVRGIRSLLLVLLSWILPVTALIFAGFLASLAFTGLESLWETRSATAVLLGAAATLVILINAAFQNGEVSASLARVIRVSVQLAALSLVPIVAIAIHALALRVDEYGWTADRIIAAACLLVATCYAGGYAWALSRRSGWMRQIAGTNVAAAYLVLVLLVAMFSPLADPARLSVNNQIARLETGKTPASQFDFEYLKFEGERYGLTALEQFSRRTQGIDAAVIRERAQLALAKKYRGLPDLATASGADIAANITVWPAQEHLPASFINQDWSAYRDQWRLPACVREAKKTCDAFLIEVSGGGKKEILLLSSKKNEESGVFMIEGPDGDWSLLGYLPYPYARCESLRRRMIAGEYQLIEPDLKDLEVGGVRIRIGQEQADSKSTCPSDGR